MNQDYYKRLEKEVQELIKDTTKEIPFCTGIGGYPLFYVTKDSGSLCPECVKENRSDLSDIWDPQWYVIGYDINYESNDLYCSHCSKQIEPAYELEEEEDISDD